MSELDDWLRAQSVRERRVVRLEDALLADRYAPYFIYRLRFFAARTLVAAFIHGVRILLLLGAFAISEFLFFILLSAFAALVADTWWGALEVMRSRIRHLQRMGSQFRAPDEIASWLHLSVWICGAGLFAALLVLVGGVVAAGELTPILAMSVTVIVGASVNVVARGYHSGAYAVRRVYRPLSSLLAADAISLGALLMLWPLIGIWAFPVAEILSVASFVSISLRYTTRTYRSLAFPTLPSLLGERVPLPHRDVLRSVLAPAISFGLVGLEALVLATVLMTGDTESTAVLVALLAALSPVIRAGFEWARLLYFDMARLDAVLLTGVRRRFERAVAGLSIIMGGVAWLIAAPVAVIVLSVRDVALVAALLPFFVARSALAAAQIRAFTRRAYFRLALTGAGAMAGFLVALALIDTAAGRVLGFTAALALAVIALIALPDRRHEDTHVAALTDWLDRLRTVAGPVVVHRVSFDRHDRTRGITPDERRKAAWRRRRVGRRLGARVARSQGLTAWLGQYELVWFVPAGGKPDPDPTLSLSVDWLSGLATSVPTPTPFADGSTAAVAVLGRAPAVNELDRASLTRQFEERFPSGLTYDVGVPGPTALSTLTSQERARVLHAALLFVRGSPPARSPLTYEVSAIAVSGSLRLLFLVDRRENAAERRAWRSTISDWNHRSAAGGGDLTGQSAASPPRRTL